MSTWCNQQADCPKRELENADVSGEEGGALERRVFWPPKRDDRAMKHPTGIACDLEKRVGRGCAEFVRVTTKRASCGA